MRSLLTALVAAAALALPLPAQMPDPAASYRTVTTQHFRITYQPRLNQLIKPAADAAERAYALLARQLVKPPSGRVDLLLSDNSDFTNGFALTLPSNRINIWVKPPVSELDLLQFRDWLGLVITHELAHIFHLDTSGGVGRALRSVFGRVPYSWPVFPAAEAPRWNVEGLAVEFETRGTGSGRTLGSFNEMVIRTAVIEDELDPIDRVNGESRIWPGGARAYIYGSLFMDYLARKHGPNAQGEIVRKTAGSALPPILALNRIGKRASRVAFTDDYAAWERELRLRYGALLDSLRRVGLTETTRLTTVGRTALYPRISPDGKSVSFTEENGRDAMRTRVIDLDSGRTRWTRRRNGIGPADWLPDGRLVTAQLDFSDPYSLYADVFHFSRGGQKRLTHKARTEEVDVDKSGTRIVAVKGGEGANRIVILDSNAQLVRELTPHAYGTVWSLPRWSPDGTRIAVSRWQEGGAYDVVVLDTLGAVVMQATQDEAIDGAPTWSPDGRFVLFWSDRTGIPNIFAFDTESRGLLQVTNLVTGAFHPDVSPDGRWIVFSAYHSVGYYLERIPYNPTSWVPYSASPRAPSERRPRATLDSIAIPDTAAVVSESRRYSPLHTMRPHYWMPIYDDQDVEGTFIGLSTGSSDLLGRHNYALSVGVDPDNGRTSGFAAYTYNRLHNPSFGLQFVRAWDNLGRVRVVRNNGADTTFVQTLEKEEVGNLTATFLRRRFRSTAALTLGGEVVDRHRLVVDDSARFIDPDDRLYGAIGRVSYANFKNPALSISREDGVFVQLTGRYLTEPDTVQRDRGYREATGFSALYKSLGLFGFAHHVLALRGSAIVRDGSGASLVEVGGTPGGSYLVGPLVLGIGGQFLPVRGFLEGDRAGNRAWSASAEYRVPLLLLGRGYKLWPFFLDRMYLSAFADAGNATCSEFFHARFLICDEQGTNPLVSAGGEIGADLSFFSFFVTRARFGVAQPISGPTNRPTAYISFGPAF